jgi:hypothetical protein
MVAESSVSCATRVTMPRSWRDEYTGLKSARKSSAVSGVVSAAVTRASLENRIIQLMV